MNKLVLFDIDRTLVEGFKGHMFAFSKAFFKVYKVETSIEIINCHGMTDQQIIIDVLKKNNLNEKNIKSKLKECMEAMIYFFSKIIDKEEIILLGGVKDLLRELEENNILIGLVTGNLETIARLKMKKIGINNYFKVGGFGSDDIDRAKLVKLAIKRAKENFNFKFNKNVFFNRRRASRHEGGEKGRNKNNRRYNGDLFKRTIDGSWS
jgi:phosphoglycolate phosphatase